jgi:hypothetical protein
VADNAVAVDNSGKTKWWLFRISILEQEANVLPLK